MDVLVHGCGATTVGGLMDEIVALIASDDCNLAASCAAAVNEGTGLVVGGGQAADRDPRFKPRTRRGGRR